MIYFITGILTGAIGVSIAILSTTGYTKRKGFFYKSKNS
jgi:hypothetical protein